MPEKLVEIPVSAWPALRDMYTKRKDRASSYNTLQTFINWKNKEPHILLTVYSLNGNWEDGTFVAKIFNQIYFNTCGDNLQRLQDALNCLNLCEAYLLAGYQDFLFSTVEQHFIYAGLSKDQYQPTVTVWYHISKQQALKFSVDTADDIVLKPLDECHAEQVNSIWPHRSSDSIDFVKFLIHQNDSVGIFEDNKLVAWCLILPLGALGLLQVIDTHKRKGFGNLAVRYMSKLLAEKDIEVTAPVVDSNVASRSMFEKLGFSAIDKVYWAYKPALK